MSTLLKTKNPPDWRIFDIGLFTFGPFSRTLLAPQEGLQI